MSEADSLSSWDIALPFLISYGVIIVGLVGAWAVTRRLPSILTEQIGGPENWDTIPTALKPEPLKDVVVWAVDTVASLTAIAAPGIGALIVLPQGANRYAALAFGLVFLANVILFLVVMFGWDTPIGYVSTLPKLGPVTIVPIVAALSNTAALTLALTLA